MNPLRWAKAEVLHIAWKRGRYMPPDRRLLADEILPTLAKDDAIKRVLSIGVAWYTKSYEAVFADAGKTFVTLEIDAAKVEYGSTMKHVTGDMCDLEKLFEENESFDAILMNGVIGYGLNSPENVERGLRACASRMRTGGILLIGVNEEKPTHIDPASVPGHELFEPASFGRWPTGRVMVPVPFRERTHTFLFWKKKLVPEETTNK